MYDLGDLITDLGEWLWRRDRSGRTALWFQVVASVVALAFGAWLWSTGSLTGAILTVVAAVMLIVFACNLVVVLRRGQRVDASRARRAGRRR